MADVWLGLGSNLGNREETLRQALDDLDASGLAITAVSSLYATAPQGITNQPEFLNCAAQAATDLDPTTALQICKAVEHQHGRQRQIHWGPRTLDIDLLFYDNIQSADPALLLPHPRLWQRAFVLVPLVELWPDLRAPNGEPAALLLAQQMPSQPVRAVSSREWRRTSGSSGRY